MAEESMRSNGTPAERIAGWSETIREVSARGLLFSRDRYDLENYKRLQDVAMAMSAFASGESAEAFEPLRGPVFSHPTPFAVGDAGVVDAEGRILLIQRADTGLWAMPGGFLEAGETPAEGVARETLEETGVRCRPVALVGVHDSRLCGTVSRHHMYHFTFLCEPVGETAVAEEPKHKNESLAVDWFPEDALPDDMDPGHAPRIPEVYRVRRGDVRAFFDGG